MWKMLSLCVLKLNLQTFYLGTLDSIFDLFSFPGPVALPQLPLQLTSANKGFTIEYVAQLEAKNTLINQSIGRAHLGSISVLCYHATHFHYVFLLCPCVNLHILAAGRVVQWQCGLTKVLRLPLAAECLQFSRTPTLGSNSKCAEWCYCSAAELW